MQMRLNFKAVLFPTLILIFFAQSLQASSTLFYAVTPAVGCVHSTYEITGPKVFMMLRYELQGKSEVPENLLFVTKDRITHETSKFSDDAPLQVEKNESLVIRGDESIEKSHRMKKEIKTILHVEEIKSACHEGGCNIKDVHLGDRDLELTASKLPPASDKRGGGAGLKAAVPF